WREMIDARTEDLDGVSVGCESPGHICCMHLQATRFARPTNQNIGSLHGSALDTRCFSCAPTRRLNSSPMGSELWFDMACWCAAMPMDLRKEWSVSSEMQASAKAFASSRIRIALPFSKLNPSAPIVVDTIGRPNMAASMILSRVPAAALTGQRAIWHGP